MRDYFIRRLLLVPITLFGITLIAFTLTRVAPGGPLEVALMQAAMGGDGEAARSARDQQGALSPSQLQRLEEDYKYDQPILIAYLQWLGVLPSETRRTRGQLEPVADAHGADAATDPADADGDADTDAETAPAPEEEPEPGAIARAEVILPGTVEPLTVWQFDRARVAFAADADADALAGWDVRLETADSQRQRYLQRMRMDQAPEGVEFHDQVVAFQSRHLGLFQGYLGRSLFYNIPVWDMMKQRMPISIFFGVASTLLIYGICIPLGIVKAIRHRTMLDTASSVVIFVGYAIPGFVLGAFLLVIFAARLNWFPIEGFVSPEFATLSLGGKILDVAHHAVLPLICYVISGFAMLTMLVKNNLMDNLAADYVRTAVAKGVGHKRAVFGHALRNSLIPVATTLGEIITLFVAGNLLVERVFDIDGFGLLMFNALLQRDQTIVLGVLTVAALLMLLGNILSDIIVASVDPRIRFK